MSAVRRVEEIEGAGAEDECVSAGGSQPCSDVGQPPGAADSGDDPARVGVPSPADLPGRIPASRADIGICLALLAGLLISGLWAIGLLWGLSYVLVRLIG